LKAVPLIVRGPSEMEGLMLFNAILNTLAFGLIAGMGYSFFMVGLIELKPRCTYFGLGCLLIVCVKGLTVAVLR
jgi:hypothetical protein